MVGNLENVDVDGPEIALGGDLDVASHQQRCSRGPGKDDDRLVVGAVITALGTEHLKRQSAHVNMGPGCRGADWHRSCEQLSCDCVPGGVGVTLAALPHFPDRHPTGQSDEAEDVVVVGVGRNNQAQVVDPILIHCLPEQARIGPAIDQHALAIG
ncbi:MAG TPA: hypothetical protein VJ935_05355 [Acidimicrobiia bacterium]|nr:hypothetical protein [Acidimicrobiia bacterium]